MPVVFYCECTPFALRSPSRSARHSRLVALQFDSTTWSMHSFSEPSPRVDFRASPAWLNDVWLPWLSGAATGVQPCLEARYFHFSVRIRKVGRRSKASPGTKVHSKTRPSILLTFDSRQNSSLSPNEFLASVRAVGLDVRRHAVMYRGHSDLAVSIKSN
jgi:hypothetical protein